MNEFSQAGTYTLSGASFTFAGDMGINSIAIKVVSGTVTVLGTKSIPGLTNSPQSIGSEGYIASSNYPLDGLVIDASAGVATLYVVS